MESGYDCSVTTGCSKRDMHTLFAAFAKRSTIRLSHGNNNQGKDRRVSHRPLLISASHGTKWSPLYVLA
jgi:hypothetical protein